MHAIVVRKPVINLLRNGVNKVFEKIEEKQTLTNNNLKEASVLTEC